MNKFCLQSYVVTYSLMIIGAIVWQISYQLEKNKNTHFECIDISKTDTISKNCIKEWKIPIATLYKNDSVFVSLFPIHLVSDKNMQEFIAKNKSEILLDFEKWKNKHKNYTIRKYMSSTLSNQKTYVYCVLYEGTSFFNLELVKKYPKFYAMAFIPNYEKKYRKNLFQEIDEAVHIEEVFYANYLKELKKLEKPYKKIKSAANNRTKY